MGLSKPNVQTDESGLLARITVGDEVAFSILYNRYRKQVYSFALKIIKSKEIAEDILHEVFLKIWQHRNLMEIVHLENYLMVATRNHTLKVLRRQKLEIRKNREIFSDWEESREEIDDFISLKDIERLLQEAIEHLPPQQKLAYRLCREDGLKYEEAARLMAISRLTVKTHIQHALQFLRSYILRNADVVTFVTLSLLLNF